LRDNEPTVLLDEGDPESLTSSQRKQTLRSFCEHFGTGAWRGLNVPSIQILRFASNDLSEAINLIWHEGVENPEIREILIGLIEFGCIRACADIVFDVASNANAGNSERIGALKAMVVLNDKRLEKIALEIVAADSHWSNYISSAAIVHLYPTYITSKQLCSVLRRIETSRKQTTLSVSALLTKRLHSFKHNASDLADLRDELMKLLLEKLTWEEDRWEQIVSDGSHLCGLLAATCECGFNNCVSDEWLRAASLSLRLQDRDSIDDEVFRSLRKRLLDLNAEQNERLFWIEDSWLQSIDAKSEPIHRLSEMVSRKGAVELSAERDLGWITENLANADRNTNDRALLLETAIWLWPDRQTLDDCGAQLHSVIEDEPELVETLSYRLNTVVSHSDLSRWKEQRASEEQQEHRKKLKNRAKWIQIWRTVANDPEKAFSTKKSWDNVIILWEVMRNDDESTQLESWNRRFIESYFNEDIADSFRQVLMKVWRQCKPSIPSERSENERNSTYTVWHLGLAGIYAESEDPSWASNLTLDEAEKAIRYSLLDLNGLPVWLEALLSKYRAVVDCVLGNELSWQLAQQPGMHGQLHILHGLEVAPRKVGRLFLMRLFNWLDEGGDEVAETDPATEMSQTLRQVIDIILKYGNQEELAKLRNIAIKRLDLVLPFNCQLVWILSIIRIDPSFAVEKLEKLLEFVEPAEKSIAVEWFAGLFGERLRSTELTIDNLKPELLFRIVLLAFKHVRICDDVEHDGIYEPDVRDLAEIARDNVLRVLLSMSGEEAMVVKLRLAADPLCSHLSSRILALADEYRSRELDLNIYSESDVLILDQFLEVPPQSNETMFEVLKDRLAGLDELLLRDVSPRELWAGVNQERILRRDLARELDNASNSIYKVDQEAVTDEEKETDIRLRSVSSNHEAVIELKLGENHSAKTIVSAIEDQLVTKYMASQTSRAGALLLTLGKENKKWRHPIENRSIGVDELMTLLQDEAKRVELAQVSKIAITVHFLDLRPRLKTEQFKKSVSNGAVS